LGSSQGRRIVLIFPAIDLRGGQCVRLRQGDYSQETVFGADPAEVARRWVQQGARYLHLVDLDGARDGRPINGPSVRAIVDVCRASGVPCQLGGGIRNDDHIDEALSWGVERIILGTRALKDPVWLAAVAHRHPQRVVLGIDARDGLVATDGWLEVSQTPAVELARRHEELPLAAIVYTDIGRDGMLAGPNEEALARMARSVALPVIASGGVTEGDDVRRLARLGLAGCIIGRALYEGRLTLAEALAAAGDDP
jgi:phosphoribosylformimino-5-aminoimidazole carboxamide ribotide isomerase